MKDVPMIRSVYASTIVFLGLLLSACGGSSTTPPQKQATVPIKEAGNTVTTNGTKQPGNTTDTKAAENEEKKQELLTGLSTKAPAEDVAASGDTLFVAEGDKGVEIIRIGYHDRIDHELIGIITGINATSLQLSEDQTRLYIQNREGYVNIYDISNINSPKRIKIMAGTAVDLSPRTKNGLYEFVAKQEKGFIVYDVSNPSNKNEAAVYTHSPAFEIVLIDQDTKALVATKSDGIILLDISDIDHIREMGHHAIAGETLGVSVNEQSGLLFVANGTRGVGVFNLNIFLDTMR